MAGRTRVSFGPVLVASLVAASLGPLGCGETGDSDPQTFDAESFVAAANDRDAGLELGEPLPYPQERVLEARVVRFEETGEAPFGSETDADQHDSGTLTVLDDGDAALAEYERCEASLLICFRAANVALAFSDELAPADVDQLTRALQAMSADES